MAEGRLKAGAGTEERMILTELPKTAILNASVRPWRTFSFPSESRPIRRREMSDLLRMGKVVVKV
ncbi:hypothetical protein GCM10022233_70680 [Streptomyces shaanxiensis]|uniref:Uncharacterized protein n=1 Tax=Streptomyces shaanxiensis TaxID=653357 RepID=A0ABP7W4P5_9ACTN